MLRTADSTHERLTAHLGEKHLLLVLDNFEQVLGAAPLIADLLTACPHVRLLVTSRIPLHLRGEQEFPVPPLTLPDQTTRLPAIQDLVEYDAIALFLHRARAVRPDFALTGRNASFVSDICRRLDGLPLAIELAAARIKALPPEAIDAQLAEHRLALLTGGPPDAPIRQQTLRRAIAWSYDLLHSDERTVFRRLAVFAGGCSLGAAQALAGDHQATGVDIVEVLAALVDKGLLQPAIVTTAEPRFVMLETIRAFALEQLDATGELDSVRREQLAYYVALAEEAEPRLFGADQGLWMNRLISELDNLRGALRWAVERRQAELGLRLGVALWWFLLLQPHLSEQREQLVALLTMTDPERQPCGSEPRHSVSPVVRARALATVGCLGWASGDLVGARAFLSEGLERSSDLGDKWGIFVALISLGHVARIQHDYATAQRQYELALVAARDAADRRLVMFNVYFLGVLRHIQGDDPGAKPLFEESLEIGQEVGDRWTVAAALVNLGHIARSEGDIAAARARYEESLVIFRQVGDRTSIAYSLNHLGMLALDVGDANAARPLLEESLSKHPEVSSRRFVALSLEGLAGVAAAEGHATRALRLSGAAGALRAGIGRPPTPAEQARLERWLQPARGILGEAASQVAWAAGRLMPLEQVIEETLQGPSRPESIAQHRAW